MENSTETTKSTEENNQQEVAVEITTTKHKAQAPKEEPKVDFEVWYSIRSGKIPAQHHKEIIKADFKGRKIPALATMAEFDSALKKYGLKLK